MKLAIFVLFSFLTVSLSLKDNLFKAKDNWRYSQFTDRGGEGKVFYLDRQDIKCNPNEALAAFQLNSNQVDKIRYKYNCVANKEAIGAPGNTLNTGYNDTNGVYSLNYLDRHHVKCPPNHALTRFHLTRNPKDTSKIMYEYNCAPVRCSCLKKGENGLTDGGNWRNIYLDRQLVGTVGKTNNHVLTGFKLNTKGGKLNYTWSYCVLENVVLKNKNESNLKTLNSAKAKVKEAESKLLNAKRNLESVNNDVKKAQAAYDASSKDLAKSAECEGESKNPLKKKL